MKNILKKHLSVVLASIILTMSCVISDYAGVDTNAIQAATVSNQISTNDSADFSLSVNKNSWEDGFSASIALNNLTNETISDWKLTLHNVTFIIDSIWCVTADKSGSSYIISNMGWNGSIQAGQSISFGFNGTGTLPENISFSITYMKNGVSYSYTNQGMFPSASPSPVVTSQTPAPTKSPSMVPSSSPVPTKSPSMVPSMQPSPVISPSPSAALPVKEPLIPAPIKKFSHSMPSTGKVRGLMIVVDFPDLSYKNRLSTSDIQNLLFGTTSISSYPYESAAQFFSRASYGNLSLTGDVFTYRAKYNRSYYIGKNEKESFAIEVLKALDSQINYADYDSDNDGYIDQLALNVPLAGNSDDDFFYGSTTTWYHNPYFSVDGKKVMKFILDDAQPTSYNRSYYLQVFCHETGHLMGLPDYYKYNSSYDFEAMHGQAGCEVMDDMEGDFSSFSKILLGWLSKDQIQVFDKTKTSQTVKLSPAVKTGSCMILPIDSLNDNYLSEYFLIEYIANEGSNRGFVGNGGIRILHVNANASVDPYYKEMMFRYENYSSYYDSSDNGARVLALVNDGNGFYRSGSTISYGTLNFAGHDSNGKATVNTGYRVSVGQLVNGEYTVTVTR